MDKEKTAMMQVIDFIKKERISLEIKVEELFQMRHVAGTICETRYEIDRLNKSIEFLKKYLPTEREQIEKAHLDGQKRAHSPSAQVSEIYYNKTYGNHELRRE